MNFARNCAFGVIALGCVLSGRINDESVDTNPNVFPIFHELGFPITRTAKAIKFADGRALDLYILYKERIKSLF
jgi:hypothetical protein